jgi:hypothetical protein
MGFSMAQGHSGPQPPSFHGDPIWSAIRDDLPGELDPAAFLAWLHEHDVRAVIADPGSATRWANELSVTLGTTPMRIGGVEVYRVPDYSPKENFRDQALSPNLRPNRDHPGHPGTEPDRTP